MSNTITETSALDRASMFLGTAMMLAWTFVIGVGGFVLLAASAYAFVTQNHTMAAISIFLLCTPLLMTLAWGIVSLAGMVQKRWFGKLSLSGPTWFERRRLHRVLYQAYFL